jgi:hypothetical protein
MRNYKLHARHSDIKDAERGKKCRTTKQEVAVKAPSYMLTGRCPPVEDFSAC